MLIDLQHLKSSSPTHNSPPASSQTKGIIVVSPPEGDNGREKVQQFMSPSYNDTDTGAEGPQQS